MSAVQPFDERQRPLATFSLRSLFLILTTAGVASVAFRLPVNSHWLQAAVGMVFAGVFLAVWLGATRQFKRLFVAGALVAGGLVLYALVLPSVRATLYLRGHARTECANDLKQIGVALLCYHNEHGSFPPQFVAGKTGKPLYSWRELILPYLDEVPRFKAFRPNEAWNSPSNAKISQTTIIDFMCQEDPQLGASRSCFTSYLAVVGPNTAWAGTKPRKLSDFKNPRKTILVVEVVNSGVNWAEPRDLNIGQLPQGINQRAGLGISSGHEGGAWVLFADAHVEFLPDTTDPKKLAEMLDIDGPLDTAVDGASR